MNETSYKFAADARATSVRIERIVMGRLKTVTIEVRSQQDHLPVVGDHESVEYWTEVLERDIGDYRRWKWSRRLRIGLWIIALLLAWRVFHVSFKRVVVDLVHFWNRGGRRRRGWLPATCRQNLGPHPGSPRRERAFH